MTDTSNTHTYVEPVKKIVTKKDLEYFLHSSTCTDIINFVQRLSESVKGKPNSTECFISEVILRKSFCNIQATERIVNILNQIDKFIEEVPALPTRSRFGNKAFVTYFDKVEEVYQ